MIYITELSGSVNVPRHCNGVASAYTMELTSNLTDDITIVENGEDISTNPLYYKFELGDLSSLTVGEYTYTLYDEYGMVLEKGLLTFGEFQRTAVVNNTFNKQKVQYNG